MNAGSAVQEADRLDQEAGAALKLSRSDDVTVGVGGEFATVVSPVSSYRDTARSQPDLIAVNASKHRLIPSLS